MTEAARDKTPAIETLKISRKFGDSVAVDGVDLSIRQGELFSLLGPNGAGKTTLIKMLCCLMRPTGGTASVMGHDVQADPMAVKSVIDVSPQETAIAERMTARENLQLVGGVNGLGRAEVKRRSDELLEMTGLAERADERVKRYSGGMKRRLSIAMALISDPDVLFLDEPTLGLDPQSRQNIWDHITALKGSKTIILTTHYLAEADALADRVAIIDEGRIIAKGTPQELKQGLSHGEEMTLKTRDLTAEAVESLREFYPETTRDGDSLQIKGEGLVLSELVDRLKPYGVVVESAAQREVTLNDVFLELTGKELRD